MQHLSPLPLTVLEIDAPNLTDAALIAMAKGTFRWLCELQLQLVWCIRHLCALFVLLRLRTQPRCR